MPKFNITPDPVELDRLNMRKDAKWAEIDDMTAQQARTWFESAMLTPEGRMRLLKYLFYKLHDKI